MGRTRVGGARVRFGVVGAVGLAVAFLWSPAVAQPATPGDPPQIEAGVAPGAPVPDTRPGEAFADPEVAALQRTATDVQRELADLADQVHGAERDLSAAAEKADAARAERAEADRVVAAQQAEVDDYSKGVFAALAQPNQLQVLLTATDPEQFLQGSDLIDRVRADQDGRLTAAYARQGAAEDAEAQAVGAERSAAERKSDLDRRTEDASNRAAAVSSELRGQVDRTNAAVTAQQQAQKERNDRTAANWKAYTDKVAASGVRLPSAAALRDPNALPAGLSPLPGADGAPQAGVAQVALPSGERLLVLPSEVVAAVTSAVGALGKPYVPAGGGEGPTAYSCDGLVRSAFAAGGIALPAAAGEQMAVLSPVATADAQPGDVVFLGPARLGVQGVGVVLDGKTMLAADARLAGVVVSDLPAGDTVLGVGRPALAQRPAQPVPQATDGGLTWRCGSVRVPARSQGEAAGAWGGYPNGLIPPASLCLLGTGSHMLRCDAAQSYQALSQAFAGSFGGPLCITDSYRSFSAQVRLYQVKPALAAVPGTSNHGWGLAVDLCGGIQSFGTAQYAWMAANAPLFGWSNPPWAQPGRGREEPWHWEYTGA
ncbi:D-alanyl-D-alanine carboxypeptidase [Actinokineospora bangkokensis]|uniref:D-alanyl-D-alanine carboxypeptidase n=2 Tax=Actinokineospora bangkokensis TaxID=1193682 RepID=A0A1Q9LTB2_9PSEU|nr:D-alanyl-D-alanine carboxypeptidase [Actinokineospora bangkokensis]